MSYPCFLDVQIKMGEKGLYLDRMGVFERKQHTNVPCTISCQEILQQSSTDKVNNK